MFAVPFGRILWKEYRTQRALWLCCLLVGFLFQAINSYLIIDQKQRESVLFYFPMLFGLLYAVGCGALLFASEREERTCDWLLSLSVPAGPLLFAKFGFAVTSTIALQLAMALFSLLLSGGIHYPEDSRPQFLLLPFGLAVLIWSIFGSLLSRRVMASIAAMAFGYMVTFMFPLAIVVWFLTTWPNLIGTTAAMCVFAIVVASFAVVIGADFWIGWRWCQGKYLDGSVFENWNARLESLWKGLALFPRSSTRLPVRAEYEQSWRRTWQRLVWQERGRDSVHALLLVAGCAMGVALAIVDGAGDTAATNLALVFCLAIPMAMGVIGFESDAQLQQSRFLCNRGISPASVWLAKQSVWMSRACWITAFVFAVSLYFEWLIVPHSRKPNGEPLQRLFFQISAEPDLAIWYVLLSYCCGQLASMMLQRVILAAVFGIVINSAAYQWQMSMVALAVPRWWSLGFPVLALLVITLWQMKARMLEDNSWSRQGKLVSVLVAAPVLLVMGLAWHRVAEVAVMPPLDKNLNVAWSTALDAQANPRSLTVDETFVRNRIDVLSRSRLAHDPATAEEIVELMKRDIENLDVQFMTQRATDVRMLTSLVLKRADAYVRDQQLDKALEYYLASLKLARTSSKHGQLAGMWDRCAASQTETLEDVVNWANHPAQTPTAIRTAIKAIESELMRFPSATEAIVASYLTDRRIVDKPSIKAINDHVVNSRCLVDRRTEQLVPLVILPWERTRLDILMTREAEFLFAEAWDLENSLATMPNVAHALPAIQNASESGLQATEATLSNLSPVSSRIVSLPVLQRQTEIRATLVRMELIAYRLQHNKLPDRLIELIATIDVKNLVDPWSNRLFDFYPTFLLSAGRDKVALVPVSPTLIELVEVKNDRMILDVKRRSIIHVLRASFVPQGGDALSLSLLGPIPLDTSLFPIPLRR